LWTHPNRYNRNEFAEEAKKLGIPIGTKLTRREWRAVRRRISKKPRRFSKKFIKSQINERNKYRATVRKLQNNPHLAMSHQDFPYDVPSPITVGTTVTAYSSTYRIIQRGVVLTYDHNTALYLIQFESKQFAYELCPDSAVATNGGPEILITAPKNTLVGNLDVVGEPAAGASIFPVHGML
jgi:hypothetical protein